MEFKYSTLLPLVCPAFFLPFFLST